MNLFELLPFWTLCLSWGAIVTIVLRWTNCDWKRFELNETRRGGMNGLPSFSGIFFNVGEQKSEA